MATWRRQVHRVGHTLTQAQGHATTPPACWTTKQQRFTLEIKHMTVKQQLSLREKACERRRREDGARRKKGRTTNTRS